MAGVGSEEFRNSARDLLATADHVERTRALIGAAGGGAPAFERAMWQRLVDAGWLSVMVNEAHGGLGQGLAELAGIAFEAGARLLPEPFIAAGVHSVLVAAEVAERRQGGELLEQLLLGRMVAGVAWQDDLAQLEPAPGGVIAERVRNGYSLRGRKRFVLPGSGADGWFVCAHADGEPLLFWVHASSSGLEHLAERRFDGSVMSTLMLGSVQAFEHDLLLRGQAVIEVMRHANDVARVAQSAELLGVARRTLELVLEHVNTRMQFGQTIGSFQALQHRMVDAYIQLELGESSLSDAIARYDAGQLELSLVASRSKARAARAAIGMTRLAIQLHGAMGYSDEHPIGLYFKRALCTSSWLGGEGAHRRRYWDRQAGTPAVVELRGGVGADATMAASSSDLATAMPAPHDADWDAMPEGEFRRMVRGFLERNYPPALRHMPYRVHWPEIKEWYLTLSRQGWIAPSWPKACGGMALPPDKLIAFIEEQEEYGVARPPDQGLVMLGPVLMRFGTDAQRARFLPKILSGEHVWCQGYSEPNAGSDLASLQTEALLDGDSFVVTGQKTWTTLAQDATHMFLLVRTDKSGKKQHGISFLLVELDSPGITVRPIRNIAGDEEFCEVFFDRVRVPRDQLVGELNQGWAISKALLGFERLFGGSPKNSQYALQQLERLARARDLFADDDFVARYAELQLDVADLGAVYAGFASLVRAGGTLPAKVSLLKIWATETHERIARLLVETAAEYGGSECPVDVGAGPQRVLAPWINALGATIFSGSNEIQRNILARQVLGLG